MKHVRLAVGYVDYGLASDLPAVVQWGGNGIPTHTHHFALVTLLEDLDFSFQCLRVAPGAA